MLRLGAAGAPGSGPLRAPFPARVMQVVAREIRSKGCNRISGRIIQLVLVADGQGADEILIWQEAIQRNVAGLAVGDHQFTDFTLDTSANEGVACQGFDRMANGSRRGAGGVQIMVREESERAFKIGERVPRINLCHGLGRAALGLRASRSSQA